MKQNIDISQLSSLSPKAQERLRRWLFDTGYSKPFDGNRVDTTPIKQLSIGEMIEFLDEHNNSSDGVLGNPYDAGFISKCFNDGKLQWMVAIDKVNFSEELIDCLFEAVKDILERD